MLLLHREKHVKAYDRVGVFTSIIPIPHGTSWQDIQFHSSSLLQEEINNKYLGILKPSLFEFAVVIPCDDTTKIDLTNCKNQEQIDRRFVGFT